MSHPLDENEVGNEIGHKQDRLLTTLERLLEVQATEVRTTLNQVHHLVPRVWEPAKFNIFSPHGEVAAVVAFGRANPEGGRGGGSMGRAGRPSVKGGGTGDGRLIHANSPLPPAHWSIACTKSN